MPRKKGVGDSGSTTQKRAHGALPDAVRATKKSSTPVASGTTAEKGAADKDKATTNRNLAQGKESDVVRTASSIVMYNFGVGPRFAYVSASARAPK